MPLLMVVVAVMVWHQHHRCHYRSSPTLPADGAT
jgi:hypothetical protein